jgi:iron complex outermembrane receptor protein
MKLHKLSLMSLALMSAFSSAVAQEKEKEIELDPITITASLTPVSASKTGRNILIIKGDMLQKLPVQSIDELLRYVPGVEVQSRGPMGVQSNITIRGGTFQQVLIILDGIRLNDPLTGHFNSYIPISPAEIDRIEILKGASSAIYGTEAVGGVLHIISKTFAAKKQSNGSSIGRALPNESPKIVVPAKSMR